MNRFTVRLAAYAVAAAMTAMFASCGSEDEPKKEEDKPNPPETEEPAKPNERVDIDLTPAEAQLAKKTAMLSYKVFRAAHEVERKEYKPQPNMVISPLCNIMAMEMIANGASDDTYTQIMEAMDISSENLTAINALNKKLLEQIPTLDNTAEVRLENAVWMLGSVFDGMSDNFAKCINDDYGTPIVRMETFKGHEVEWMINDWGRDVTRGVIYALLSRPFTHELPLVLSSASHIKGAARHSVADIDSKLDFINEDGTLSDFGQNVSFGDFAWYSDSNLDAVRVPMGNEAFSTVFVVPRDGVSLDACLEKIDYEKIYDLSRGGGVLRKESAVFAPQFSVEYSGDAGKLFNHMGITKAFDPKTALFTGINPKGKIYLGSIPQSTKFAYTGYETEAGSVAWSIFTSKSSDSDAGYLNVDRPFAFIIAERSTGLPLFMGRVTKL